MNAGRSGRYVFLALKHVEMECTALRAIVRETVGVLMSGCALMVNRADLKMTGAVMRMKLYDRRSKQRQYQKKN